MLPVPYERIVQWTAGPIAILAGWAATYAEVHFKILDSLGLGRSKEAAISKAIIVGLTYVTSTVVTYAAHHKWLDNLSKFWTVLPSPAVVHLLPGGAAVETPEEIIAGIEAANIAAQTIQSAPGADPATLTHALAPDPPVAP